VPKKSKTSKDTFLGVDIGGTKVAVGLVSSRGDILTRSRGQMLTQGTPDEGIRAVFSAIDVLLRDSRAKAARAIGVSVPGWIDEKRGMVVSATNIPCWHEFPLAQEIAKHYRLPVRVGNDGNVAALAEAVWGAGVGYRNVFYATLGTGIGAGVVFDGRIYTGRTGAAAEGGHMTIDYRGPLCGCGKRGCIEAYASGTALGKRAQQRLKEAGPKDSQTLQLAGGQIADVTCEIVAKAAAGGDKVALEVLNEAADHIAIWLSNIIELLEPDVIVLGGGIGPLMMSYADRIRQMLGKWAINPRWREIPILGAKYGADSALVGAAALCLSRSQLLKSAKSRQTTKNPK
jgi:glucokinase